MYAVNELNLLYMFPHTIRFESRSVTTGDEQHARWVGGCWDLLTPLTARGLNQRAQGRRCQLHPAGPGSHAHDDYVSD